MDNVDDIIKQRLQGRIAEVLKEYQNGNIRREVEEELENKHKDEKLRQRLKAATESHETSSNLFLEFRFFWQALFFNKRYYNALYQIYGSDTYKARREQAAGLWIFFAFILIMAGCYYLGWQNIDDLETYQQYILEHKYRHYTLSPVEGLWCLFLLAFFPFCLSLTLIAFVNKKPVFFIAVPALCQAIYVPIMLVNRFAVLSWGGNIFFAIEFSVCAAMFVAMLAGFFSHCINAKDAP